MADEQSIWNNRELFAAIAGGSVDAFERFFYLYKERIFKQAFEMVRSEDAANELSQIFFLKLWEKRSRLVTVYNPGGYLYTSLHNLALNYLRDSKTANRAIDYKAQLHDECSNATQEWLDERQLMIYINKAASELPELKQKVFDMRRNGHADYKEIGKALNITPNTAKMYYHDAVKQVREYLVKHFDAGITVMGLLFIMEECI